jgi:hypothetical protein
MKKRRFSHTFRDSCLIVAEQVYGRKGIWAYDSFVFINELYFAGRLPWAHILWGLTAHGGCIAWASTARDRTRPPIVTLHPSLLGGTEKADPWGISPDWLGPSLVFDTLLHECIHIHIDYNLGGHDGRNSHDCKRWMRQVNRLAPQLGFVDIHVGISKTIRVPDYSAPLTQRGNVPTRVVRRTTGNVPYRIGAGFPGSLRRYLGQADEHYRKQRLPPGAPPL